MSGDFLSEVYSVRYTVTVLDARKTKSNHMENIEWMDGDYDGHLNFIYKCPNIFVSDSDGE